MIYGARWNSPGRGPIYAAETYSGALLEILVRIGRPAVPPEYCYLEIDIPDDLAREEIVARPEETERESVKRARGDKWFDGMESAVLMVPSAVTRIERNVLINPRHPEFGRIQPGEIKPVWWDRRLFKS